MKTNSRIVGREEDNETIQREIDEEKVESIRGYRRRRCHNT